MSCRAFLSAASGPHEELSADGQRAACAWELRQPGHLGVQQLLLLALQLAWVAGYEVAAEELDLQATLLDASAGVIIFGVEPGPDRLTTLVRSLSALRPQRNVTTRNRRAPPVRRAYSQS
jgi:hypothetical protein